MVKYLKKALAKFSGLSKLYKFDCWLDEIFIFLANLGKIPEKS